MAMKIQNGTTWNDFHDWVSDIESKRKTFEANSNPNFVSRTLFRGQANAEWRLLTTLERADLQDRLREVWSYYKLTYACKSEVESFTSKNWPDLPKPLEYLEYIKDSAAFEIFDQPDYAYQVHLRHHGFPSPLLDWSYSPFVAAFFAFREVAKADQVAIYAFIEYCGAGKTGSINKPSIRTRGPIVSSHRRHFMQQSSYTVCVKQDPKTAIWTYEPHDSVFYEDERDQDLMWCFTLPSSERENVLRYLHQHNINAFTLFGSEESLMEKLSIDNIVLKEGLKRPNQ